MPRFGGIVELIVGVRAEQKPLEDIAEPLTAAGAEPEPTPERKAAPRRPARRWRLGPGSTSFSPFPPPPGSSAPAGLEREVAEIRRALDERGVLSRRELAARTRARRWGPGRFSAALGAALDAGAVRRVGWSRFAPVRTPGP